MNTEVFITCAVTGVGATTDRSELVPVTPAEIADAALEAAGAGAAIVHIHVRDPATGGPSRDPALYGDVVERIRSSDVDVVLNLTAGMGGDLVLGGIESPLPPNPVGTDMAGATERLAHVAELRPEICTLDCGTMNFAEGDYVMTNTPSMLREMARQIRELGVRPEIEVFDTGHLVFAKQLIAEGLVDEPAMLQLCMGIPYGAPDDPGTLLALVNQLPSGCVFSAFAIGRMQLPYVALAPIVGGNVRVGLEDNIWLERGVKATNGQLVERAVAILEAMNVRVLGPAETREKLQLPDARRPGRRRRHRRRLGRPARRERRRRGRVRPAPRGGAASPRGARERRAGVGEADAGSSGSRRRHLRGNARGRRRGADVIQESAPEDVALKRLLLADIEDAAPPDALIASSTSGLLPSQLQAELRAPGSLPRGPPVQPGVPAPARRGRRRRAHVRGRRRRARSRSTSRSA